MRAAALPRGAAGAPVRPPVPVPAPRAPRDGEEVRAGHAWSGVRVHPAAGALLLREPLPGAEGEAKGEEKADPKAVLAEVEGIVGSLSGIEFKRRWEGISAQVTSPADARKTKPGATQQAYPGLFAPELVAKLRGLSAADREKVSAELEGRLAKAVTGAEPADLRDEYRNKLSERVRRGVERGFPGYVALRGGLLGTFGTIDSANTYYATLVAADFPSASSKVAGRKTLVHPNLKKRLDEAAKALAARKVGEKTWLEIAEAGIEGIGGFNIRENRNRPTAVSDHSFGWAIDIDAALNPNIPAERFPKTLVEGLTGEDVYGGAAAAAFRAGGATDALLPHARTLRSSSDTFKAAFASEASLRTALSGWLRGKGITLDAAGMDTLATLLEAERTAGKKERKAKREAVEKHLSDAHRAGSTPSAAGAWTGAPAAAAFLAEAWGVFKRSFAKGTERVKASPVGSAESVAAHGFLNLPAELIAALAGSDGGNLHWLGDVRKGGTKDFMHFQLKAADRPALPKGTPALDGQDAGGGEE